MQRYCLAIPETQPLLTILLCFVSEKEKKEKDTHKFLAWKVSVPFFVQKDKKKKKKKRTPIFSTERFIGALFFVIPSMGL